MWERRETTQSEFGTEATYRGKRRIAMATGRLSTNLDEFEVNRRLDPLPLPERVLSRKIVVSPKTEDDKGEASQ